MSEALLAAQLSEAAAQRLETLQAALAPQRAVLLTHPMYADLNSLPRLRVFMQHHAFAVWDFMSLLKWLQREFTCVTLPWQPRGDRLTRRLINEIVLGEESDTDGAGSFISHFEMYLQAMQQCGASTTAIEAFVNRLHGGEFLHAALNEATVPVAARAFVNSTFELLSTNSPVAIAASFALGREDLIPDMFRAIVGDLHQQLPGQLARFHEYLERHIELDGDEHTPLALRMLANLCGDDDAHWQAATTAALQSLQARARLWDGVRASFQNA